MLEERFGAIKFKGKDATVLGTDLKIGDRAPEFLVQGQDWMTIQGLGSTHGKVRIIAAVPSLDTEVCDRETRRFNQESVSLGTDIVVLVISTDLPYAQKRWCGAAGIEQVSVLSDHMNLDFGNQYACTIKESRVLRRAVFVIDRADKISYAAYMPALGDEPDYPTVLAAAKAALE